MFTYKTEEELQKMTSQERDQYAAEKRVFEAAEAQKAINKAIEPLTAKLESANSTISELEETVAQLKEAGQVSKAPTNHYEANSMAVVDAIKADFEKLSKVGLESKSHRIATKVVGNMSGAGNVTPASGIVQTYRPGVALGPDRKVHFRDLVRLTSSATGQYVFYRENTPAGEGAIAFQVTHNTAKSQIDYDYTKVTVALEYLAGYATVARQMMEDLPWLTGALPDELLRDFYKQEDTEFYTLLSAAATAGVSAATEVAERIIDFVTQVENADYSVSAIVISPTDWGNILKTIGATAGPYSLPGAFAIAPNGDISFAGIPVIKATWIEVDKVLVGDWSRTEIVQASGLNLDFSFENGTNFIINAVTAKIEQREGLAILRPNAFVFGDLGLVV